MLYSWILGRKDFSRREYRPAPDIVNSVLNLGYSFLANEASLALAAAKLDVELGFLHSIHYGRNSLALDLMEEFRAPFVDAWMIHLFNSKILTENDFEDKDHGYFLSRDGYHKFLDEFHKHAKAVAWRKQIALQSSKLKTFVLRGETYEPFEFK